ncbi:MAG: hypothetical protein OEV06_03495 [Anaerolineae bacterium]|nr:hypothetical protein [Anaerolineae bacterium]
MSSPNESEIRNLVESLFPDRSKRLMALEVLAGCISEANCFGRSKWWIALDGEVLQLKVNDIIICRLGKGSIGLTLDKGLWDRSGRSDVSGEIWQWKDADLPGHTHIDARHGWYTPDENRHDDFWSWARMLTAGAIFAASQYDGGQQPDPIPHSHAALRYLRNEINHHVPDPLID